MGLFKKLKKAFKKVTGFVKKTIKKTVKAVKKIGKKIKSSKILKALVIAAAIVVTGGAAMGALGATTGAGLFGSAAAAGGTGFAGWMTGTAASLTSTALGSALATPFTMLGTGIGTVLGGATGAFAISNAAAAPLTSAQLASVATTSNPLLATNPAAAAQATATQASAAGGLNLPTTLPGATSSAGGLGTLPTAGSVSATGIPSIGSAGSGTLQANITASMSSAQAAAAPIKGASWFARHPKLTAAGTFVGRNVGGALLTGAVGQYMAGDPETQGSMAGAAVEGAEYMDPLKVYAAQQGINTDSIYQHMLYGNQDPSSMYGNDLYRQQTFGVA